MRFEYLQPDTVEDAITLLTKYGEQSKIIAGGTDLVVRLRNKTLRPQYVIDITRIRGLSYINFEDGGKLKVGALTTIRDIETSPELRRYSPVISQAASQLGSAGIRNVATMGGNLCNATPSAEMVPALIVLSASIKIVGPDGERMISLEEFFTGPGQTTLKNGELLLEIEVPASPGNTKSLYLKHAIRGTIDLAIAGVAVSIRLKPDSNWCQDIRIALGAVAPTPIRARRAEEMMMCKEINEDLIEKSAVMVSEECCPISDVRASAEYRKEMVKVLTRRALRETTRR